MNLRANIRKENQKRDKNLIPAVIYGPSTKNQLLFLDEVEFTKVYNEVGESSLIDLKIEDQDSVKALVKEVQFHVTKNKTLHVDLYQVDMKKKITTEIPLEFTGSSIAEKEKGALIMKNLHFVDVECLPGDLVDYIEVSLDNLKNFGEAIHVRDLKIPEGMEIFNEEDEVIVSAIEPKQEAEPEVEVEEEAEVKTGDGKDKAAEKTEEKSEEKE